MLARLGCRGSVYVAPEGVNGQLSVPEAQLDALSVAFAALRGVEGLKLNVQHASLGTVQADAAAAPYRKLIVREKRQILTDGLTGASLPVPPPSPCHPALSHVLTLPAR